MEKIFPFLIGLAVVAFQIYNNFRKEQQKARKRNPSKPTIDKKTEVKPKKVQQELVEEVFDPDHPYEPQYKRAYTTKPDIPKTAVELKYERMKVESVSVKNVNPEELVEEEINSRIIHQHHQYQFEMSKEIEEESSYADFDLKDAVIKQAILNRPQY